MQQLKKMGPIGGLLELIPGMGGAAKEAQQAVDRGELKRVEAIIQSMTLDERRDPRSCSAAAAAAHRARLGHHAAGRQPAAQAVRRDAEDDAADGRLGWSTGAHAADRPPLKIVTIEQHQVGARSAAPRPLAELTSTGRHGGGNHARCGAGIGISRCGGNLTLGAKPGSELSI